MFFQDQGNMIFALPGKQRKYTRHKFVALLVPNSLPARDLVQFYLCMTLLQSYLNTDLYTHFASLPATRVKCKGFKGTICSLTVLATSKKLLLNTGNIEWKLCWSWTEERSY